MSEKKEYIERGALIGAIEATEFLTMQDAATTLQLVTEAPAADVEPVVRGEWKDRCVRDWVCSLCGCEIQKIRYYDGYQYSSLPKFCPDCGAHMERSGSGE